MNGIFTKIILFIIGALFLTVLIFSSFLGKSSDTTVLPDFGESQIGEYIHVSNGAGELTKSKIVFEKLDGDSEGTIYEKNIDIFTSIYSDNTNYNITTNKDIVDIKIGTGTYIINSITPFKRVHIDAGDYQIILDNGGMIYIENGGSKSLIASLNSLAEVQFYKKGEQGVNMYLYPHMYLGFKPSSLQGETKFDSLRISQLATLGYFSEDFSNILAGDFSKLISNGKLLGKILDIITLKKKNNNSILESNIPDNIDEIPGMEYIEKYFLLFYNERKKLVYHQNKILEGIIKLLESNEINNNLISEIETNLKVVKSLDGNKYTEMLKLIDNFSHLAFDSLNNDVLYSNFSLLNINSYGYSNVSTWNLSKDFDRLNFNGEKTFYNKIQKNYSKGLEGDEIMQDYYLFFVRNIILNGFEDESLGEDYFNKLVDIFNQYSNNLRVVTTDDKIGSGDSTREITNIVYNERILKAIRNALLSRYFGERNSKNLLVRTKEKITNVIVFEEAVNHLHKYYSNGKILLEGNLLRYSKTIQNYELLDKQFGEYFSALKNYSKYQKTYSYEEVIVISDENNKGLTRDKFIEYMKNFNGVDLSSIKLEIVDDGYIINNISIDSKLFSFFLNPYRGNRLMDILAKDNTFEINSKEGIFYNQLGNTTYEMDEEQKKYEKLLDKAKDENRDRLDFKNFFKNNFFPQESLTKISCEEDINCKGRDLELQNDDELIQLFKTATLLGDRGEFRNIRKILDIKYVNLHVNRIDRSDFEISIDNASVSMAITKDRKSKLILADFDSEYKLDGNHYFYNIIIKPYIISTRGDREYMFKDIPLHITGDIGINVFEDGIKDIFTKLDYINLKYKNYLLKNTGKVTMIEYSISSGNVTFE
ncbi:hypothetical protein LR004_01870 [Candidatus Gracilibacteria bacterium]|nr:hypothetical protein [Candidatus Gracilibacteria bacterium]